jgi:hypothetical protein
MVGDIRLTRLPEAGVAFRSKVQPTSADRYAAAIVRLSRPRFHGAKISAGANRASGMFCLPA